MNISYNWLKKYINVDLAIAQMSDILTNIGLEVEAVNTYESIKGGLEHVYIGKVITCEKHPNADRLHITTVDIGKPELLNIVCGAPNVAAGQHVVVATIGATLHPVNGEPFVIKKSKIRDVTSEGMICAEDELGIGNSHEGIMVLNDFPTVGTPAKEYFKVVTDTVFEIGLTPNRSDAVSHIGVARDVAAYIKTHLQNINLTYPDVSRFPKKTYPNPIRITIQEPKACPRYTGLYISKVKVKESPDWLKHTLNAVGIRPINNIVDITQFVMLEMGQPLHAFDADRINGNHVIIQNAKENSSFTTLDDVKRTLTKTDLMICNATEPMCMAGVFGGKDSGVSLSTTNVFLESAYFNPVSIRKTAKHHGLKTDASFRYERGCDPSITVDAIKRTALLIQEIAGGEISEITDVYPEVIKEKEVNLHFNRLNTIVGATIEKEKVKQILTALEIKIINETDEAIRLAVPTYKEDVTREVDVIEEFLRIYGYNNIGFKTNFHYTISSIEESPFIAFKEKTSSYLSHNGFYEIINNSLTKNEYNNFDFINKDESINLLNPLSKELQNMRQNLLLGGLETIIRNINHSNFNLRLYEFGSIYKKDINTTENDSVVERFPQQNTLALFATGQLNEGSWQIKEQELDFFYLKNMISNILSINGLPIQSLQTISLESHAALLNVLQYSRNNETIISIGEVRKDVLTSFGIKQNVYYAEINCDKLLSSIDRKKIIYKELNKFPEVHRDLALLIDKHINYEEIEKIAFKVGKNLIKSVQLFDVYEGKNLEENKKSYAVNFVISDANKTLTNDEINKVMDNLIAAYTKDLGAKLR